MSWKIAEVTLPVNPTRAKVTPIANIMSIPSLIRSPIMIPLGPESRMLTLEGNIREHGQTVAYLETNYLLPLRVHTEKGIRFPYVIADENQSSFWSPQGWGSGSLGTPTLSDETVIVSKGINSLKAITGAGALATSGVTKIFSQVLDLSLKDFMSMWWYGTNNSMTITCDFVTSSGNYYSVNFIDNFTGWLRKFWRIDEFSKTGSPDWASINWINITWDATGTFYLDRLVFGIGVLILSPGNRHDGIYVIKKFPFEEKGGITKSFAYKMDLLCTDTYY